MFVITTAFTATRIPPMTCTDGYAAKRAMIAAVQAHGGVIDYEIESGALLASCADGAVVCATRTA